MSNCGISWSYSFLVYYNHNISALLSKLPNDITVCQCTTQTVNYLTIIIAIVDLFKVECVRFRKPKEPNLQYGMHLRDD